MIVIVIVIIVIIVWIILLTKMRTRRRRRAATTLLNESYASFNEGMRHSERAMEDLRILNRAAEGNSND